MRGKRGRNIRLILMLLTVVVVAVGCARTLPQEVVDVNRALGETKDACASVYAAQGLESVQNSVDNMNELADAKKYKKARKAAEPILPEVNTLRSDAAEAREGARAEAEGAIAKAEEAVKEAQRAEAPSLVASAFGAAESKLTAAKSMFEDPCKYREAAAAAAEAARLAANAKEAAIAERKRLDEAERKRAEEERRRREEEEARRLEEERRKKYPPVYTVQRGDSLWRITGMESIYGDSILWPILYDANGDLISDPDLIYPGQELQIPRGMSADEMQQKLHMLWRKLAKGGSEEE